MIKQRKHKGFTLIELIIGIFIFGIIATLSVTSMVTIIKSFSIVDEKTDVIGQLQFSYANLTQDISLMLPDTIRTSNTTDAADFWLDAPFKLNRDKFPEAYIGFLRLGTPNATFENRSYIQHVFYIFKNNAVTRYSWQYNPEGDIIWPSEVTLLTNVAKVEFEFENSQALSQNAWHDTGNNQLQQAPEFIKFIVTFEQEEPIERWFALNMDAEKNE